MSDTENNFNRVVEFKDLDNNLFNIEIEIRKDGVLSISGNSGSSSGQLQDSINPKNKYQKRLLEIWNSYHLNNMHSGTEKQETVLKSWTERPKGFSYTEDCIYLDSTNSVTLKPLSVIEYNKIKEKRTELKNKIVVIEEFIKNLDTYYNENKKEIKKGCWIIIKKLDIKHFVNNEQKFFSWRNKILKDKNKDLLTLNTELDTEKLKTLLYDIHENKVYEYGHGWIKKELPNGLQDEISNLCFNIKDQELKEKEKLNGGSWDDIEDNKIIILGQFLKLSPNEAMQDIEEGYNKNTYSYCGIDYFIGDGDEARDEAREYLTDDTYIYQMYVENEIKTGGASNIKNIDDWSDWVIDSDGYGSILNSWDGTEDSFNYNDTDYYIIRRG